MDVLAIISDVGLLLLLVNVIIYFTGFTRNGKAYKYFSVYLLSIFIIQTIMITLAYYKHNNHFLSSYYLFFQFILLSTFFYMLFVTLNKKKSSAIKYISAVTVAVLSIQYCFNPALYYTFNSTGFLITSLLLTTYAVLYIFELLTQKLLFNYVATGIFIYLISSALIFASATSIVTLHKDVFTVVWQINAVLFVLYQLLILWEWKQHFLRRTIK